MRPWFPSEGLKDEGPFGGILTLMKMPQFVDEGGYGEKGANIGIADDIIGASMWHPPFGRGHQGNQIHGGEFMLETRRKAALCIFYH
jgi:hypothetical protein